MQNENDAEALDLEFFTEEQLETLLEANGKELAATKWCKGKVTNTAAGNWCSDAECKQHLNKTYYYRCDGAKCPIQSGTWYMIPGSCTPGGQKYLSSCKVYFGSVSPCS